MGGGFTEEGLRKISEFQRGKQWCLGLHHSKETKEQLRQIGLKNLDKWKKYSHLGPKASSKKVVCLNTGIIYESAKAAARENGIVPSLVVELCLRNKRRKTAKGLVFRYLGDHHGGVKEAQEMIRACADGRARYGKLCAKKVVCLSDGQVFIGTKAAGEAYGIHPSFIAEVCRGKKASAHGMRFIYAEESAT